MINEDKKFELLNNPKSILRTTLHPRIKNCLLELGIREVSDLNNYSMSKLKSYRLLGIKSVLEIQEFILNLNMSLENDLFKESKKTENENEMINILNFIMGKNLSNCELFTLSKLLLDEIHVK